MCRIAPFVALGLGVGPCAAQPTLYGLTAAGHLVEIDPGTGAGTLVRQLGPNFRNLRGLAFHDGFFYAASGGGTTSDVIRFTLAPGSEVVLGPSGFAWTESIAICPTGQAWAAVSIDNDIGAERIGRLNLATGAVTGAIPFSQFSDANGLAFALNGEGLYAVDFFFNTVGRCDPESGVITGSAPITGAAPDRIAGIAWTGTGFLGGGVPTSVGGPTTLYALNRFTGVATRIGPVGFDTIAGLAIDLAVGRCYADCDEAGCRTLDIFDFLCFQNRFAAGDPYACDCDTTSGRGVCDIFDFLCFQNAFAAGCP